MTLISKKARKLWFYIIWGPLMSKQLFYDLDQAGKGKLPKYCFVSDLCNVDRQRLVPKSHRDVGLQAVSPGSPSLAVSLSQPLSLSLAEDSQCPDVHLRYGG